jgi:hypothetical protein
MPQKKQGKRVAATTRKPRTRKPSQNASAQAPAVMPQVRRILRSLAGLEAPCSYELPGIGSCRLAAGHAGEHAIPQGPELDLMADGTGTYRPEVRR